MRTLQDPPLTSSSEKKRDNMIYFSSNILPSYEATDDMIAQVDEATWAVYSSELQGEGWDIVGGQFVRLMSEDEVRARNDARTNIPLLRQCLNKTDYQAIKYSEGAISEEDYAPIRAQRQAWRDEINRLEALLG